MNDRDKDIFYKILEESLTRMIKRGDLSEKEIREIIHKHLGEDV